MDLTPHQISLLERLHALGFEIVAFPMYANYIGVKRGSQVDGKSSPGEPTAMAALLAPIPSAGFSLYSEPTVVINGNLSARITRNGRDLFVWKSQHLEATPALLAALASFRSTLLSAINDSE